MVKKMLSFAVMLCVAVAALSAPAFSIVPGEDDYTVVLFDGMEDSKTAYSFENLMFQQKNYKLAESVVQGHSKMEDPVYQSNIARRPAGNDAKKTASLTYILEGVNLGTTEVSFDAFYDCPDKEADLTAEQHLENSLKYLGLNFYVSADGEKFSGHNVSVEKHAAPMPGKSVHYVKYTAKELPAGTKFFKIEIPSIENAGTELNTWDPAINSVTVRDSSAKPPAPKKQELKFANVYMSNMILQANEPVVFAGFAESGTKITATLADGSKEHTKTAVSDSDNRFKVVFESGFAPGYTPYTFTATDGIDTITFNNIMFGDVFLFAGQSNMEWKMDNYMGSEKGEKQAEIRKDMETAGNANFKIISADNVLADNPSDDAAIAKKWRGITKNNISDLPAVPYYFGQQIQQQNDYPVGIISVSWGGTWIQSWLKDGEIYNNHIYPFRDFKVKAFLWYQGESDNEVNQWYYERQIQQIDHYRELFGEDMPFCMVQLANYEDPHDGFRFVREAQLDVFRYYEEKAKIAGEQNKVGLVSIIDQLVADPKNIHPEGKKELAQRLAIWTDSVVYGKHGNYSGPVPVYAAKTENGIEIVFDHAYDGLAAKDSGKEIGDLQVIDKDGKAHDVTAIISAKNKLLISADIPNAASVRYAYREYGTKANLINSAKMSAPAFDAISLAPAAIKNIAVEDGVLKSVDIISGDIPGIIVVALYSGGKLTDAKSYPVSREQYTGGIAKITLDYTVPSSCDAKIMFAPSGADEAVFSKVNTI